jgi:hypothetical protein
MISNFTLFDENFQVDILKSKTPTITSVLLFEMHVLVFLIIILVIFDNYLTHNEHISR